MYYTYCEITQNRLTPLTLSHVTHRYIIPHHLYTQAGPRAALWEVSEESIYICPMEPHIPMYKTGMRLVWFFFFLNPESHSWFA